MPRKAAGFRLSRRARQDLEDIWLYTFQQWSSAQADAYVADLLTACEGLASGEKIARSAHDIREGYHQYRSGSHSIYFKLSDTHVDVLRILHQSMDVGAHLGD